MYLIVDGRAIRQHHSVLMTDSYGRSYFDLETGVVYAKEPDGSPLNVGYAVSLEAGTHTTTLVIERTSGQRVAYTWSFTLVE